MDHCHGRLQYNLFTYALQLFSIQCGKQFFFFLSAAPPESHIRWLREVRHHISRIQTGREFNSHHLLQFAFMGYALLSIIINMYITHLIFYARAWEFIGAQKKWIECRVWLELNTRPFGFEFGLLRPTQFGFQVAWRSRKKKHFPRWIENSCNNPLSDLEYFNWYVQIFPHM